jgi:hypothetical protein
MFYNTVHGEPAAGRGTTSEQLDKERAIDYLAELGCTRFGSESSLLLEFHRAYIR